MKRTPLRWAAPVTWGLSLAHLAWVSPGLAQQAGTEETKPTGEEPPAAPTAASTAPPPSDAASSEKATASGASPNAAVRERPLAELPAPPSIALGDPTPADKQALDALLKRVTHEEPVVRERAVRELLEVQARWLPAVHARLDRLADRADKLAMKDALQRIRDAARRERRAEGNEEGGRTDLLQLVVERASPESETWRNLAEALALSRMLRHIGNVGAARSLVHVYVRFGEFLRVNTQLELEAMGDRSLAALIEARRHPAQKIAQWAERQLDLRGKAIAGEALRTEDQEALADILRAFGRIRDPDASRIILSFAQSERAQLRTAAREAVALLGEVATWQLRDAYENAVGKRPPREWTWERTARELFTEFDRLRQAEEYELFERGLAAHQAGRLAEMVDSYDRVLAYNPMFERRDEMSAGYLDYARQQAEAEPERAIGALRRAERVCDSEEERRALRSLRLTLEARQLLAAGIADQGLLHQALALDPNNRLAEETLEQAFSGGATPRSRTSRYWGAGAIAGLSLLGALGILWSGARRRHRISTAPPAPDPTENPAPPAPDPTETPAPPAPDSSADAPEPESAEAPQAVEQDLAHASEPEASLDAEPRPAEGTEAPQSAPPTASGRPGQELANAPVEALAPEPAAASESAEPPPPSAPETSPPKNEEG